MTDNDFRRVKRKELIEMIRSLQRREQELKSEKADLIKQLDDRSLKLEGLGSIAEASLALNHVFEDAQAAADQYLAEAKANRDASEAEKAKILSSARHEATSISSSANFKAETTRQQAERSAADLVRKTEADIRSQWQIFHDSISRNLELNLGQEPKPAVTVDMEDSPDDLSVPYAM